MRTFEIILLVICTLMPLMCFKRMSFTTRCVASISLIVILVLHYTIEGHRWQMYLAYIIIVCSVFFLIRNKKINITSIFKKIILSFLYLVILGFTWLFPVVLPVFELPELKGEYSIGSREIYFKGVYNEVITPDKDDKRELKLKVWYPADVNKEPRDVYLDEAERSGLGVKYGLPKSTFSYLDQVETNTFKEPPVVSGKFPTLVFSHGQYSNATAYYSILEQIASQGYIIVVINHTYESVATKFSEDQIVYFDKEFDARNINKEMRDLAWSKNQEFLNADSQELKEVIVKSLIDNYVASEITKRWSKDISAVVSYLETLNDSKFFRGHIDLDKIGLLGHSQGGAAIVETLLDNDGIIAGVNLDGVQWGSVIHKTIEQPLLLLSSDWPEYHPDYNAIIYNDKTVKSFESIVLKESGHSSFMDIPYVINIPGINEAGTIDKIEASTIISDLIVSFFNVHMKEEQEAWNEMISEKSESIIVKKRIL